MSSFANIITKKIRGHGKGEEQNRLGKNDRAVALTPSQRGLPNCLKRPELMSQGIIGVLEIR